MATSATPKRNTSNKKLPFRADLFVVELLSRLGVIGAIVGVILYTFLTSATNKQKIEFIDNFVLLKILKNDEHYLYFSVLCAIMFYLITIFYYKSRLKIKEERIKYLEEDLAKCEKIKKK